MHAQELAARAARGGYWPALNLSAARRDEGSELRPQTPTLDNFGNAGLPTGGMAWNVWGGVQLSGRCSRASLTRGQVREADAALEAARAERDALWSTGLGRRPAGARPACAPRRRRWSRRTRR